MGTIPKRRLKSSSFWMDCTLSVGTGRHVFASLRKVTINAIAKKRKGHLSLKKRLSKGVSRWSSIWRKAS